jgi:putative redox protein
MNDDTMAQPGAQTKKEVTVTWVRDSTIDAFVSGHHVVMDQLAPAGHGRGPSPKDLLLAALAGCTILDVVSMLKKQRQQLTDIEVRAEGFLAVEHPKRFAHVVLTYTVRGQDLNRGLVERAVSLSEERYCGVSATLKENTTIETRVVLEPNPDDAT